jgi:DNA-binding MarR family transcriptional regulator
MEEELSAEFARAMMRLKKLRGFWSNTMGLNMSEAVILRTIGSGATLPDGRVCTTLIRDRLHISKPAISQNLTSLEEKGLITRSINRSDRRRFDFTLTEEGIAAADRMHAYAGERMTAILSLMGKDDVCSLIRLLNKLGDIIEDTAGEDGSPVGESGPAC